MSMNGSIEQAGVFLPTGASSGTRRHPCIYTCPTWTDVIVETKQGANKTIVIAQLPLASHDTNSATDIPSLRLCR